MYLEDIKTYVTKQFVQENSKNVFIAIFPLNNSAIYYLKICVVICYEHNVVYHYSIFSLVSAFSQKNKTYKTGLCVCAFVCVQFWSPPQTISKPVIRLIRNFGYI